MKRTIGLRTRLIVASALLVATTVAASAWSAWSFLRLGRVVGSTVTDSEQTIDAISDVAGALEREDDGVLQALTNPARGRAEIARARARVSGALARADGLLTEPQEKEMASRLRRAIDAYHAAADALVADAGAPAVRTHYSEGVNPLLRAAIDATAQIRDKHFRSSQEVAAWARDQSASSVQIVAAISLVALLLSAVVVVHLARVVMTPISAMTRAVDAYRAGDFTRRTEVAQDDELGRLAAGLNRMADELSAFRAANIGEVIRAKETLEATLAALPDAVVVTAPDGRISATNARAVDLIGTSVGAGLDAIELPQSLRDAVHATLRDGGSHASSVDLAKAIALAPHGDARRFLPRVVPIDGPPGTRGAVLVLSDVSELVRLDEMRLELVAVASHELRTPLTTLRMTLLMLQEDAGRLDARARELLATALVGIEQLSVRVGEFLDLTQIEAGQLRLRWDRVSIVDIVAQCARAAGPACEGAMLELHVDVGADLPPTIVGDQARLVTVLANLLSNAVKYSPAGGRIELRARVSEDGVALDVRDEGVGVPPELRDRIFEKFFRVEHHRADNTEVRGSGIGLYIARQIVEAHGGTIRCDANDAGRGSRFVVTLPAERALDEPPPVAASTPT